MVAHFRTDILKGIDGRHGEVAALYCRAMSLVPVRVGFTGVPCRFLRKDLDAGARHIDGPFHGIKNEELGFGSEICGVSQSRGLQIFRAALCNRAGIAVVALPIRGFDHVAGNRQRGLLSERIDK